MRRSCSAGLAFITSIFLLGDASAQPQDNRAATIARAAPKIDRIFSDFATRDHIPGLVYGIVADGRLAYVKSVGLQDLDTRHPVTPDTLFRIASMTKAFTGLLLLNLRDQGKVSLEAPAASYVPEMKDWRYPTTDSPLIRVGDLLSHTPGFATDNPWGDRQTPISEAEFTRMLKAGMALDRAPGTAMRYSNLGYALIGRIIANRSGHSYAEEARRVLLGPLGMKDSGFAPSGGPRRAIGYRWENGAFAREPDLGEGAFSPMGGLQTSANDYARWMGFLLAAWPPRDGADTGPVKRATVRELARPGGFPLGVMRPGDMRANPCRQSRTYAKGFYTVADCDLGLALTHNGGYPGYGSTVLLLPDAGVGIFAFASRTYAGPAPSVWNAALALKDAGALSPRALPVSTALARGYGAAVEAWAKSDIAPFAPMAAMNFFMDRSPANWKLELSRLKALAGNCDTKNLIIATGMAEGDFSWRCTKARVTGSLLLAPIMGGQVQSIIYDIRKDGP